MPLSSDKHIIDQQFSKKLRRHKATPSGRVWNRVSDQLYATSRRQNSNGRWVLLTALLLLLSGSAVWITGILQPANETLVVAPNSLRDQSIEPATQEVYMNAASKEKSVAGKMTTDVQSASAISTPEEQEVNSFANPSTFSLQTAMDKTSVILLIDRFQMVPYNWTEKNSMMEPLMAVQLIPNEPFFAEKQRKQNTAAYPSPTPVPDYYIANARGLYFGFGQNMNATFIADQKAFKDENLRFTPTFGIAMMVQGGYNLSNKWGLEGAWVIHSQQGQRYKYLPVDNRTTSLEYNQKHISFNYMQFPVMMRYKVQGWSGITESPFFVNYSLGVQYGRLISYSVDETKERVSNQNLFRKNEAALVASLDYDFISKKAMFFTLGIRTSLGSNLFVKNTPEYLEFDDPHNLLLGIHAAINFSVKKHEPTTDLHY